MTRNRLYKYVAVLWTLGALWLAWVFLASPAEQGVCLFKAVTHVPCPSCGSSRALVLLLKGDLLGSLEMNPVGALIGFLLVVVPVWIVADVARRRDTFLRTYRALENVMTHRAWVSVSLASVLVMNWIWNIIKGL